MRSFERALTAAAIDAKRLRIRVSSIGVRGRSHTVRTDEVGTTRVTIFYFRLSQRTGDMVNTGCIRYFSHSDLSLMNNE